jgi:aerobic carbon-monoxide dehydrogenase medium subunit
MKPPPFRYYDPRSLEEVVNVKSEHGTDAAVLAGGQSLVPMLNLRLRIRRS